MADQAKALVRDAAGAYIDSSRPILLVTGASGFIGNRTCVLLVQQLLLNNPENHLVVAIARSRKSINNAHHYDNLIDETLSKSGHFALVYADLSIREQVMRLAGLRVDIVYHCAARGGDWGNYQEFWDCNVVGTENITAVAKTFVGLKRFLHVSTVDVYPPHVPTHQCDEEIRLRKKRRHGYSVTKTEGENVVKATDLPWTITRPAAVFGPKSWSFGWEEAQIIWNGHDGGFNGVYINGANHAFGGVFLDDCIDHMFAAANAPKAIGGTYNCSAYQDVTWRQYYHALADGIGKRRPTFSIPLSLAKIVAWGMETFYHMMGWEGTVNDRPLLTLFLLGLIGRPQLWPMDRSQKDFGWKAKTSFQSAMDQTTPWLKRTLQHQ